jgi:uncharacterized SAM-binding protein YcdF (DUF218 family)
MGGMRSRFATRILLDALRGVVAVAASVGGLLLLVAVLVLLQAQRDETRPAGAAVVLAADGWGAEAAPRQARLDHVLDLYQRGVVSRIILTGGPTSAASEGDAAAGRAYLVERGVPESVLLLEDQGVTTRENLRAAAERARASGIGTVLLIGDPPHMLRSLKIARDAGLVAYASPAFNSPTSRSFTIALAAVARESWSYTTYIFAGR